MKAALIDINPDNPQPRKIQEVVEVLRKGGVIIYPTDTVYGLGCDIRNKGAIEKIIRIKQLDPKRLNLSFICYDLSHISDYTKSLPNHVFKVMKKALPGPFTFILPASNNVPRMLDTNKKTVGIRVPAHAIPRLLVKELGNPVISTSVKEEDDILEYATDPELIYDKYKSLVDIVINGGPGNNVPSTVVDCVDGDFTVVRDGIGNLDDFV